MPPYFVPASQHLGMVPITLAAVGPHSLRLAGEVADGVRLHGFCTRRYLTEEILPRLSEGMARSGRDRGSFEITGGGFIATGVDIDAVAKMVEYTRGRIAFYGSTPGYWPVLELHGLGDLGRKLNAMSKAGKWAEMAAEVSDDVVALFTAIGTYAEITEAIERRFGGLSDALNVGGTTLAPTGLPPDLLTDIKRIDTPFGGYRTVW
jgi:probable F420-dependent oxidoreductase